MNNKLMSGLDESPAVKEIATKHSLILVLSFLFLLS